MTQRKRAILLIDYNAKLAQETAVIRDKVRRGMLPLVARNPALDKATREYAEAQAAHFATLHNPPIALRNSDALDDCADLVLHEELTWSHPDKMSIVEFPVMSDRNEQSNREKYTPHSDLQYGDRRFTGRRKTHFTDDYGAPQVRSSRVIDPRDPTIEAIDAHVDLYDALENAGLTERQREAINLVYFGDMTQSAAACVMGVSQPAVAKFERQALAKLREYMTKY